MEVLTAPTATKCDGKPNPKTGSNSNGTPAAIVPRNAHMKAIRISSADRRSLCGGPGARRPGRQGPFGVFDPRPAGRFLRPTPTTAPTRLIESSVPSPAVMAGQRETPTLKNGIGAGGNADLIIAALQRRPDLDD